MCGKLLTTAFSPILRDFYDFAATVTGPPHADYPTPAVSNSIILFTGTMADSVRNTIEEYGAERLEPGDVIVAQRPVPDGHARQRHPLLAAGLPRGRDRRLRQPEGAPPRHGRRPCPAASAPRRRTSTRTASCSRRGRSTARAAGAGDVEPDLRQRPLRLVHVPGHADDLRQPRARRAAAPRDRRALRRRGGARRDRVRLRRGCRADDARADGDPRRHVGGGGLRRLRRDRRHRGVPGAREADEARRPGRGRPERHLTAGALVHQRHRARREDDGRDRLQVPLRSAHAVHVRDDAPDRRRRPAGDDRERAAARTAPSSSTGRGPRR